MKTIILAGAAALVSLGSGCSSVLHTQSTCKQDSYMARAREAESMLEAHDAELKLLRHRDALAAGQRTLLEKEIALLKAKAETREVEASLRPAGATTVPAGFSPGAADEPVAVGGDWKINPGTGGIVLDAGILFVPGSATLRTPVADQFLSRLVNDLNRPELADAAVRVDGHTDDTPIQKSKNRDNWELAGKRALAVLNYLEEHGVSPERLSFGGFGAQRPLVTGASKTERAQNRRVEVVLVRRK